MLDSLFIHTIIVTRRTSSGESDYGDKNYGETNVYEDIPARVETYSAPREQQEYRDSGQRRDRNIVVYVKNDVTIQVEDKITWQDIVIGKVDGIYPAVLGANTTIDHYELSVQPL